MKLPDESSLWNLLWVLPLLAVTWITATVVVFLPLLLVGIPVMVVACRFASTRVGKSILPRKGEITEFKNPVLNLWLGNREDGLCPNWWRIRNPDWSWERLVLTWFLRNPVANLRYLPVVGMRIEPARVRWCGADREPSWDRPGWFVAWDFPYASLCIQTPRIKFWMGWKILPEDRAGIPDHNWRFYGVAPFALVRRNR